MIINIDTTLDGGSTLELPLGGDVDVTIDWGDGGANGCVQNLIDANLGTYPSCTYAISGAYQVRIEGSAEQFGSGTTNYTGSKFITSVESFGGLGLNSLSGAFRQAPNLTQVPSVLPSTVTDLSWAFIFATSFNGDGVTAWDTTNVTNMARMFQAARNFNQDISGWNTSNVTSMYFMFPLAEKFNQDISGWDVSNVTSMTAMLDRAYAFNQDLSGWCVSNITSEPVYFDDDTISWVLPKPKWGSCPAN